MLLHQYFRLLDDTLDDTFGYIPTNEPCRMLEIIILSGCITQSKNQGRRLLPMNAVYL